MHHQYPLPEAFTTPSAVVTYDVTPDGILSARIRLSSAGTAAGMLILETIRRMTAAGYCVSDIAQLQPGDLHLIGFYLQSAPLPQIVEA